jgi:hypothetical protein
MGVDTGVSGSPCQVLVFPIRDVCAIFRKVLFGQSEIDNVQLVTALSSSHQEVIRFYISVEEISGMDILDSAVTFRVTWKAFSP